jgi:hypothetical protein
VSDAAQLAALVGYMLLVSLAMSVADLLGLWRPRGGSVLGIIVLSLPPLVALMMKSEVHGALCAARRRRSSDTCQSALRCPIGATRFRHR